MAENIHIGFQCIGAFTLGYLIQRGIQCFTKSRKAKKEVENEHIH